MLQKSTVRVALAMLVLLPSLSMAAPLRPRDPELDEIITSDPIENQAHPVNHVPHIGHEEDYNHDNTAYIDKPEPSNHPVHHHGHHHHHDHHDHHESLKEEASKAALEYLPYADITGGLLGIFEHVLPLDYHHSDKHHPHPHHHSHHHGHHAHHHSVHHGHHDHHHGHGSHVGHHHYHHHHHHHHHDAGHHGMKLVPWVHDELFDTGYFDSEAYLDIFYDDIDYEDVVLHILESLSKHHGHGHRVSVHDGHHSEKASVTVTGAVSDLD